MAIRPMTMAFPSRPNSARGTVPRAMDRMPPRRGDSGRPDKHGQTDGHQHRRDEQQLYFTFTTVKAMLQLV
jgi:hypothetical protein